MHKVQRLDRTFLGLLGIIGILTILILVTVAAGGLRLLRPADREMVTETDAQIGLDADSTPAADIEDQGAGANGSKEFSSTELILENTKVYQNDLYALAEKYKGIVNVPVRLQEPPRAYEDGASKSFWVLNVNTNRYRDVSAILAYQTDHLYFWIEEGVEYNAENVAELADTFEWQIYHRNRSLFGSERSPGVDNDPHLTILYANDLGGAAGYFSSADSFTREIERFSNIAEMFYLSAEHINLASEYVYGVMAHEFQHMIHWNMDRDEEAWVNEGLSELAVELNGFDLGGFTTLYLLDPDLQLNFWPGNEQGSSTPHYGASYLFVKYLQQRFGETFIKELVAEPENGFDGIEKVLGQNNIINPDDDLPAERIFQDWTIATYLNSIGQDGFEYGYDNAVVHLPIQANETVQCDEEPLSESVKQFGADHISVECPDDFMVEITWNETIPVVPVDPHSGVQYFWSNRGDESAMRLWRRFDLTNAQDPITFSYWTWFDIESDYDYVYVNLSEDGEDWENLVPSSCTREDPTGANYGCGYNGKSSGWVQEEVDISAYAGKEVILEFEYITDAAVNGEGFLVDDVRIDAIGYFEDFEAGGHGWKSDGFVEITNSLAQKFGISVLDGNDAPLVVQEIRTSPATYSMDLDGSEEPVMIILSGLSQYTHQPANYTIRAIKRE